MSDSLTQCRSSNYDWRGEQQSWGPSGKKESSSFWELSVETGTVLDDSVSIEEVLLPSFRIWNFLLSTPFNNGIVLATIIFSFSREGFVCCEFCCHELNNYISCRIGWFWWQKWSHLIDYNSGQVWYVVLTSMHIYLVTFDVVCSCGCTEKNRVRA